MDTQTLIENLRGITSNDYEWKFAFYTAKKNRDGIALDISSCVMQDIVGLADTTILALLEKVLPEKTVAEYTPFLSKETIGALEQSSELVREPLQDIVSGIQNAYTYSAEDYITGLAPTPTGYLLYGLQKSETGETQNQILLIKRSNPFIKGNKTRLCISSNGEIAICEKPMLKFTLSADLLLVGGVCYILSAGIEKDLGLENRQVAITSKRLGVIAENSIVNNYEELEKSSYLTKNSRKYLDFDREVLDYIAKLPILERADFLSEYGLVTDEQGLIDTNDSEQCELFIDLLCGRSCHDALGRLSVGSNIMPR